MSIKLEEKQLKELDLIVSLISKYRSTNNNEERNELIKLLAQRHIIAKGYLSETSRKQIHPDDIEYIEVIYEDMNLILMPEYERLTGLAVEHIKNLYVQLTLKKGGRPFFPKYQEKLVRWLLSAIIKHEIPKTIYTLLVSRSTGKTFCLSLVSFFLELFWDRYVIHNGFGDFRTLCSAPQMTQLGGFIKAHMDFIDVCITSDTEIGLIGRTKDDDSLLDLFVKYKSQTKIELARKNGATYSTVQFVLGTKGAEGQHGNLHLNDEGKFLSKHILHRSLIPTVGNRVGIFVMLSSAHHEYSEYQATIERNIRNDIKDFEELGVPFNCITWSGNPTDKDRLDDIKSFSGRRHLQINWESDNVILENQGYSLAVERELEAVGGDRNDISFATQYDNRFTSSRSASFFDIKELRSTYNKIFEDDNINKYLDNGKYTIIAGVDPAVSGDSSLMFIKALESGFGSNRTTKIIAIYCLNPMKNKNSEHILNQSKDVVELIKQFKIRGLAVDESGIGKSMTNYIKDILREQSSFVIDHKNILPVVITTANRSDILDFYYNRIQSGQELFFHIPKEWESEEYLKPIYINSLKSSSEEALKVITIFEHMKFVRTLIKNEETGMVKPMFKQSEASFLHDDSLFASSICSWLLKEIPDITNFGYEKPNIGFNNGIYNRNF